MEQDEQQPAEPEQGESPFGAPPITLSGAERPPVPPYSGPPSIEAVLALILAILGVPAGCVFYCSAGGVTIWMELGALMLAVAAKKKVWANPGLGGDGLATAAIWVALIILTLCAAGSVIMLIWMSTVMQF